MKLTVNIDGTDRSVIMSTLQINRDINGRLPQATFTMNIPSPMIANYPSNFSEVIISNTDTGTKLFRGFVSQITIDQKSIGTQFWQVSCIGLEYLLQNITINQSWTGVTDRQILQDAFTSALPEITTDDSTVSVLGTDLTFAAKDLTLIQLVQQVAALTGADWRVTENKELLYWDSGSIVSPFGFSDHPNV